MTHPVKRIDEMTLGELSALSERHQRAEDKPGPTYVRCPVKAIIYICPTKDCGNYYAAPDFTPINTGLQEVQTRRSAKGGNEETHTRLECPRCRVRGIHVDRVPYIVAELVKLEVKGQ